jgi:hypothetical protein
MSYSDYKIIDDKSGLIVPDAIMKTGAAISQAFSTELKRQKKETDDKNKIIISGQQKIREDGQKAVDNFNKTPLEGGEKLVNSFKDTMNKLQSKLTDIEMQQFESNYRNMSAEDKLKLDEERGRISRAMGSLNQSWLKAGVITKEALAQQENANADIGVNSVFASPEDENRTSAIIGAPDTSFTYSLGEDFVPMINFSGGPNDTKTPGMFAGAVTKTPYQETLAVGAFNSDRYDPIVKIPQTFKPAQEMLKTALADSKGVFRADFLQEEVRTTVPIIKDNKPSGTKTSYRQNMAPQGIEKFNEAHKMTMSQIKSTVGDVTYNGVMQQYAINPEMQAAYADPTHEKHEEAVSFVGFSVAKKLAADYKLNAEIVEDKPGTYNYYKDVGDKDNTQVTDSTQYSRRVNDANQRIQVAARKVAGLEAGPARNMALFYGATGLSVNQNLGTRSRPKIIKGVYEDEANNTITYEYGNPYYGKNLNDNEKTAIEALHVRGGGNRNTAVKINGVLVKAYDYLKNQNLTNLNSTTIDFNDANSVTNGLAEFLLLERSSAANIFANNFSISN